MEYYQSTSKYPVRVVWNIYIYNVHLVEKKIVCCNTTVPTPKFKLKKKNHATA